MTNTPSPSTEPGEPSTPSSADSEPSVKMLHQFHQWCYNMKVDAAKFAGEEDEPDNAKVDLSKLDTLLRMSDSENEGSVST